MGSRIFAIMGRAVSPPATLVSVRNGRRPRFMARPVAAASVQALADRPGENARPSDYPCDAVSGPPSGGRSERPRHEPRCGRGTGMASPPRKARDFHKRLQWDAAITCEKGLLVRSRGLEPPRVAPLAPQASASTNSATTAEGMNASRRPRVEGARCNKSTPAEQGPRPVRRSWWRAVRRHISADCGGKFRHLSRNAHRRGRPPRDRLSADTVVPRAHSETIASHRDIITWWPARAMM